MVVEEQMEEDVDDEEHVQTGDQPTVYVVIAVEPPEQERIDRDMLGGEGEVSRFVSHLVQDGEYLPFLAPDRVPFVGQQ